MKPNILAFKDTTKKRMVLTVSVDLCYRNECPEKGGEGVRQQKNKNVMMFKFIVVKNVISSQVTGLFAFDRFLY